MKHYRVTAFFPEAPVHYAHGRILVAATSVGYALCRGVMTLSARPELKGRHLTTVQVTATLDLNTKSEGKQE